MSVIMGATYPDVFAGVAVGAGLEYKAATSMVNAFTAMSSGGPDPTTQGDVAYKAQGSYSRPMAVRPMGVTIIDIRSSWSTVPQIIRSTSSMATKSPLNGYRNFVEFSDR